MSATRHTYPPFEVYFNYREGSFLARRYPGYEPYGTRPGQQGNLALRKFIRRTTRSFERRFGHVDRHVRFFYLLQAYRADCKTGNSAFLPSSARVANSALVNGMSRVLVCTVNGGGLVSYVVFNPMRREPLCDTLCRRRSLTRVSSVPKAYKSLSTDISRAAPSLLEAAMTDHINYLMQRTCIF